MRGEARGAMTTDELEILVALLVIRHREHFIVAGQPLGALEAVTACAVLVPVGWIGPAEAVHRVQHPVQGEILGEDLDHQNHHVDVVEKAEVDVRDVERHRLLRVSRVRHAYLGDIGAAKDANRRFGISAPGPALCVAVQEAPHVRQERDEFAVVPFVERARFAAERVRHLAPRIVTLRARQKVAVLLDLLAFPDWHELQRPEQDLLEVPDNLVMAGRRRDHRDSSTGTIARSRM